MRGSANLFCTTDSSSSSRNFENSYFKKFRQDRSQDVLENDNQQFIASLVKKEVKENAKNKSQAQSPSERLSKRYNNEFSGGFARREDFLNNQFHVRNEDSEKNPFKSYFTENTKGCPMQTMARQQYKNFNAIRTEMIPSNDSLDKNDLPQAKLQKKQKEKLDPKLETLLELVEKQEMNAISLLNEMSGKLKQKVEYTLTEGLSGNTKQNAKSEAAKQGFRTLLTEKQYLTESAALILSIQKAQENMMKQKSGLSPFLSKKNAEEQQNGEWHASEELSTFQSISSMNHQEEKSTDPMKSSLYELNVLARRLAIEPIWFFPFEPNAEGYFKVSLQFGSLLVTESAKRKQDAKKEAAAVMIKKIKEAQSEEKSFHLKAENMFIPKRAEEKNIDKAKANFERALRANMLKRIVKQAALQDIEKNYYEEQAKQMPILNESQLKSDVNQNLEDFFHKIENYTSMITSNPKQIMLDEKKHLADCVKNCYLTPVGSFALGCMRVEKLVIDAILTYDEGVQFMEEKEFLELYKYSLQTCYALDQESGTNIEHMKFSFTIENEFLQIKSMGIATNSCLTLNIFIPKQSQDARKNLLPIQHIHNIYSHLNGSLEELKFFRKLLRAIRIWNQENLGLNIEILDIILLAAFLMDLSTNIQKIFARWRHILNSTPLASEVLKHFNHQYFDLYKKFCLNKNEIKSWLPDVCL